MRTKEEIEGFVSDLSDDELVVQWKSVNETLFAGMASKAEKEKAGPLYNPLDREIDRRLAGLSDTALEGLISGTDPASSALSRLESRPAREMKRRRSQKEQAVADQQREARWRDYRSKSTPELKGDLQRAKNFVAKGSGRNAGALRDIPIIEQILAEREEAKEKAGLRNLRLQTWAALVMAFVAVIGVLTPVGPWIRSLLEAAGRSLLGE